jgi:uncharacterized damage-inducible protein DinB
MLPILFDHLAWADARARESIAGMPESAVRDRALALYAHIVAIEHAWLARFEERTPEYPQWPSLSLEAAGALATSSAAGLRSIATAAGSEGLYATITYRSRAGIECRNSLWEILMHILLHGTYHRGQIALLARDGGGVPASTDFSTYLRERSG